HTRHPDLPVPDHVQNTESVGVFDEPGSESISVEFVCSGCGAFESSGGCREVAGPTFAVFAGGLDAVAGDVVGEASVTRLLVRVQSTRRQAAGCGGIVHTARFGRECAVGVAWGWFSVACSAFEIAGSVAASHSR